MVRYSKMQVSLQHLKMGMGPGIMGMGPGMMGMGPGMMNQGMMDDDWMIRHGITR
jgi:hypothetical protein